MKMKIFKFNISSLLFAGVALLLLTIPGGCADGEAPVCGCNEYWSVCNPPPETGCDQTCETLCKPGGCGSCIPACRCVPGYIRREASGPCIPKCDCPPCKKTKAG